MFGDSETLEAVVESPATALAAQVTAVDPNLADERVTAAVSAGITPGVSISGRVLHDVDGDGDVDEDQILQGVEVTLYVDAGNGFLRQSDVDNFGSLSTTTDASGYYEFTDLAPDQTYFVVVNSLTLGEHFEINGLLNSGFQAEHVWGCLLYTSPSPRD